MSQAPVQTFISEPLIEALDVSRLDRSSRTESSGGRTTVRDRPLEGDLLR